VSGGLLRASLPDRIKTDNMLILDFRFHAGLLKRAHPLIKHRFRAR